MTLHIQLHHHDQDQLQQLAEMFESGTGDLPEIRSALAILIRATLKTQEWTDEGRDPLLDMELTPDA